MRKRLLTSVVLAVVSSLALASGASPALVNLTVTDDEFSPKVASSPGVNGAFQFQWDWNGADPTNTAHKHNVVQNKGLFKSGEPTRDGDAQFLRWVSAGKYPYHCEIHGDEGMKGKVKVAPARSKIVTVGDEIRFRVFWATDESQTGNRFDVRFRKFTTDSGGQGAVWKSWKENTRKHSAVFGKNGKPVEVSSANTTYQVQARSQKRKERKRSGWSPKLTVEFN